MDVYMGLNVKLKIFFCLKFDIGKERFDLNDLKCEQNCSFVETFFLITLNALVILKT